MLKTIIVYSFPAITLYGLITNTISFIIFSRKRFRNTIFSTYHRFYLVSSTFCIVMPINKMFESNLNQYFSQLSDFTCIIRFFFAFVNYAIIAWFLVIISIDRFLGISYPSRFSFRKKLQFQILISFFIILFNLIFYIPYFFYHLKEIQVNQTNSTDLNSYECVAPGLHVVLMDLFQSTVIPSCLMIIFTIFSIRIVFKSRQSTSINSIRSKDIKFVLGSIIINVLYILFNLPYYFVAIIKDYTNLFDNLIDLYKMLDSFTYFLFYVFLGFSFFVNYFVNSMFRKELEIIYKNLRIWFLKYI